MYIFFYIILVKLVLWLYCFFKQITFLSLNTVVSDYLITKLVDFNNQLITINTINWSD